MKIMEFINKHRQDEEDCECIINPDGTILEAQPSHIRMLEEQSGMESGAFNSMMEKEMEPLFWLVEYTGCISVWKTRALAPVHITEQQEAALEVLHDAAFLSVNFLMEHTGERYEKSVRLARQKMSLAEA